MMSGLATTGHRHRRRTVRVRLTTAQTEGLQHHHLVETVTMDQMILVTVATEAGKVQPLPCHLRCRRDGCQPSSRTLRTQCQERRFQYQVRPRRVRNVIWLMPRSTTRLVK